MTPQPHHSDENGPSSASNASSAPAYPRNATGQIPGGNLRTSGFIALGIDAERWHWLAALSRPFNDWLDANPGFHKARIVAIHPDTAMCDRWTAVTAGIDGQRPFVTRTIATTPGDIAWCAAINWPNADELNAEMAP
jgi:hypothetical protein